MPASSDPEIDAGIVFLFCGEPDRTGRSVRRDTQAQQAALAQAIAGREAVFDRLAWQLAELSASLDKIAMANALGAQGLEP